MRAIVREFRVPSAETVSTRSKFQLPTISSFIGFGDAACCGSPWAKEVSDIRPTPKTAAVEVVRMLRLFTIVLPSSCSLASSSLPAALVGGMGRHAPLLLALRIAHQKMPQ